MAFSSAGLLIALLMGGSPPDRFCDQVQSPFVGKKRGTLAAVAARLHSKFGAHRSSYIKGHKHSGVDLRGRYREPVYSICRGVVLDVAFEFPHRTVFVAHQLANGTTFISAYKHIADPLVSRGDWVEATTPIARLFSKREHRAAKFGRAPNHLHLEIRKNLDDDGTASFSAMSREELLVHLYDPLDFMKARMD